MNRIRVAAALLTSLVVPAVAEAQAWAYPSFQPPRVINREYNFGIADADRGGGASLVFQWREQSGPQTQFSFDIGIADTEFDDSDILLFGGVGIGYRLGSSSNEVPLDFMVTGGIYLGIGDITLFRLPIGLSLGHQFNLGGGMALTPYLHPRLTIDVCNDCGGSDVGLVFDLGANFKLSSTVSIRGAAMFAGDDTIGGEGFGISLAWTPAALARRR